MTKTALAAAAVTLIQFILFKWLYPFPSFFQDSYTYIDAAMTGGGISYRPNGYSWFLIAAHYITSSDTFLVFGQYFLLQAAGYYLYYSILKLYSPQKTIGWVLFVFLLLDPLHLYIANTVSSDALFTALSLVWLTELLWLLQRPVWWRLVRQLALLVVIFSVRYNALYYPVIASAAFLLTRSRPVFKIVGVASGFLVLAIGVTVIGQLTKAETGVRVFSAFSGWQAANNALYVYPYITVDPDRLPSRECRELDSIVKTYFASAEARQEPAGVDTRYMWTSNSPLKRYLYLRQERDHTSYFTAWNRVAPVLSQYGYYLMSRHPLLFAREYGWPSSRMFFYPPLEMLVQYNEGAKEMDPVAVKWFHYKSTRVRVWSYTAQRFILGWAPALFLLVNILFVIVGTVSLRRRDAGSLQPAILLTGVYFLVNAAFCIFATPNMLRYQMAPLIWLFVFVLLACDRIIVIRWNPAPAAPME